MCQLLAQTFRKHLSLCKPDRWTVNFDEISKWIWYAVQNFGWCLIYCMAYFRLTKTCRLPKGGDIVFTDMFERALFFQQTLMIQINI